MSVLELLRGATSSGTAGPEHPTPWHRALVAGAGAALASSLVVVLPALVAWVASPRSTVPWTDALGLGAGLWLLAGGARLQVGAATVAFVPLLLLAALVAAGAWSARRTLAEAAEAGGEVRWGILRGPVVDALALWTGGYAAVAAAWGGLAFATGPPPHPLTLVLPVLAVPAGSAALALRRVARDVPGVAGERWRRPGWLPDALRRAVRPALTGAAAMLGVGTALVVLLLVARLSQVAHLHEQLGAGVVGSVVLTVGQVLAVPNAGLWAVSFTAGTGLSVVEGASTTWTGSRSALMPMVPGLGALPDPGAFPGAVPLVVVLPVAVGMLIGWRSLRAVARLSTTRTKATVTGAAVVLAAGLLGLLDGLGGGSLGVARLSDMGAPAPAMALALLVEFGVGAALVLGWDRWRLRR